VRTPCTAVSPVTRRGWTRTGTASPVPAAARGVWSGGAAEAEVAGCCATWRRPGSDGSTSRGRGTSAHLRYTRTTAPCPWRGRHRLV
jgi:hypothetical protein